MANLPIIGLQDSLPAGEFHLPVCIDATDLHALLSDLQYAAMRQGRTETPAWNRILNALAYIDDPQNAPCNNCADYGGCQEVPAIHHTIDYAPNDPRIPGEPVPPNYLDNPWYIIQPGTLSPYAPGDIVTDLTKIPILANLPDLILNTGLPTITIHATGEGEVEIELLKMPTGGYCMITVDDNPLTAKFIPCNSLQIGSTGVWWLDVFNEVLEGDLFAAEKHEVRLTGTGAHVIRLVALPDVGGETLLGFGFGLRSVTYCDFPTVCEECVDMNCADVLACLDDVPAWQQINNPAEITLTVQEIAELTETKTGERATQYDGTPQSIMTDTSAEFDRWSWNPGWTEAITAYMVACFEAKLTQMRQIEGLSTIVNLLLTAASTLSGGGWLIKTAGWANLSANTYATHNFNVLFDALQDEQNLINVVKGIIDSGFSTSRRVVSFPNFQTLADGGTNNYWNYSAGTIAIRQWLKDEIFKHPLMAEKNYLLLLQAIHTANHHKTVFGDPMWRAWTDNWLMWRGKDYSNVGVQMLDGYFDPALGYVSRADGISRHWDILFNSPQVFKINTFNGDTTSSTASPIRPTELTVRNKGVVTYNATKNYPSASFYYPTIGNVDATSVRFTAHWQESGSWLLDEPYWVKNLTMDGANKPPVGFWTPD